MSRAHTLLKRKKLSGADASAVAMKKHNVDVYDEPLCVCVCV